MRHSLVFRGVLLAGLGLLGLALPAWGLSIALVPMPERVALHEVVIGKVTALEDKIV